MQRKAAIAVVVAAVLVAIAGSRNSSSGSSMLVNNETGWTGLHVQSCAPELPKASRQGGLI